MPNRRDETLAVLQQLGLSRDEAEEELSYREAEAERLLQDADESTRADAAREARAHLFATTPFYIVPRRRPVVGTIGLIDSATPASNGSAASEGSEPATTVVEATILEPASIAPTSPSIEAPPAEAHQTDESAVGASSAALEVVPEAEAPGEAEPAVIPPLEAVAEMPALAEPSSEAATGPVEPEPAAPAIATSPETRSATGMEIAAAALQPVISSPMPATNGHTAGSGTPDQSTELAPVETAVVLEAPAAVEAASVVETPSAVVEAAPVMETKNEPASEPAPEPEAPIAEAAPVEPAATSAPETTVEAASNTMPVGASETALTEGEATAEPPVVTVGTSAEDEAKEATAEPPVAAVVEAPAEPEVEEPKGPKQPRLSRKKRREIAAALAAEEAAKNPKKPVTPPSGIFAPLVRYRRWTTGGPKWHLGVGFGVPLAILVLIIAGVIGAGAGWYSSDSASTTAGTGTTDPALSNRAYTSYVLAMQSMMSVYGTSLDTITRVANQPTSTNPGWANQLNGAALAILNAGDSMRKVGVPLCVASSHHNLMVGVTNLDNGAHNLLAGVSDSSSDELTKATDLINAGKPILLQASQEIQATKC